tara:strand:+ start:8369 stop:8788 length:420 start_codon:yes stop_codon:yes gene_type:complete
MSNRRRKGREAALQLLFASDIEGELSDGQNRKNFWELCNVKASRREFAEELVNGVLENLEAIDSVLRRCVDNYELPRLAAVDRNLLRLATYEILLVEAVPPAVAINEAIEIAKDFGTPESSRFINGILDRAQKEAITAI